MKLSLGGLGMAAAAGYCVAFALAVGGIAWGGWHAAEAVANGGAEPESAVTSLRLLAALLLVSVVSLFILAGAIAVHAIAQVRDPLEELERSIGRLQAGAVHERMPADGPVEVRRLIQAVNAYADSVVTRERRSRRMMTTAALDALIAGVAHEVNTPVTALVINEEIMYRQAAGIDAGRNGGSMVDVETLHERNVRALKRLRDLTRGLGEILRKPVQGVGADTGLVVGAAVALTHHHLPAAVRVHAILHASQRVDFPSSDLFHALHQILLHHARRLTDGDEVEIRTRDTAEGVFITVRDTGVPLPHEIVEVLNDPAALGHDEEPSAIELLNVLSAMRSQGARVWYRSDPSGNQFRLVLPLDEAVAIDAPTPVPSPTPLPAAPREVQPAHTRPQWTSSRFSR